MNDEWYTPPNIIALAREVMGGIDLDPASCEEANRIVWANSYCDKVVNGLDPVWSGRIWLNPPYSRGLIGRFVKKLLNEVSVGRTKEAICLVNNSSETEWFQALLARADMVCLIKGRIKFYCLGDDGELRQKGTPRCGQAVFYFGRRGYKFVRIFGRIGWVSCAS